MSVRPRPLAATLARVSALDQLLGADLGPLEPGWFPATRLHDPASPELAEALARAVARYPAPERRVMGSFFANEYAWYVPAAAVAAFLAEGRAPDLSPEHVALRFGRYTWSAGGASGEAERLDVRFLGGRFATLPGDPEAGHEDAVVLPDAAALRAWLRSGLEAHLAPLFVAVTAWSGLGARAQWNLAADSLAAVFLEAGRRLGDEARGQAEGLACVRADGSRFRNAGTGYVTVEAGGHCETFRTRGGCCLFYRIEPGNKCAACVLRPAAERLERLRAYLARKHAEGVSA